ncbi:MAG: flavodoxin reductase [Bacteroidetes bacterium]|nr:flavodoxin reductase [Bacteroidota bacterium]
MTHIVKILNIEEVTHDVLKFTVEKPNNYNFKPGQATTVSINKDNWKDKKRPFTFTSLNSDNHLEFIIKIYTDHDGVTKELGQLKKSDELIIEQPWGAINYKGPGYFIAGGAGITPFIAIFRDLDKKNKLKGNTLFFSNKTEQDIILKSEFEKILGDNFINVITHEKTDQYIHRFIDKDFLKDHIDDFSAKFYVCGPPKMTENITEALEGLGAETDSLVFEK